MRYIAPVFFILPFVLVGCEGASLRDKNIVDVESDDVAMNSAIAKAQATFPVFVENWKRVQGRNCNVKFAMETTDGGREHILFEPLKIDGENIIAVCSNEPRNVDGLQIGDKRQLQQSAVSDWMIIEAGKCYGGYTIRVLSEKSPDEAPPMEFADYPDS